MITAYKLNYSSVLAYDDLYRQLVIIGNAIAQGLINSTSRL
ncbi:MAG: hypothetical protein AAF208_06560 [Cyanobacteria bacterium P01_A01_bin.45]